MACEYPDDGHIYVCVRVRDAKAPDALMEQAATRQASGNMQQICVSTLENVLVVHDPKKVEDASCIARDADGVVQYLTHRSSGMQDKHLSRKFPTTTSSASFFEVDSCLNSMDTSSMLQMPLVLNSDFIQPPKHGTQEDVYLCTATHAVTAAVEGINSCVFAYGQTGSGKTFTLFGDTTCISRDPGVVPRVMDDLFQRLDAIKRQYEGNSETDYSCRVQLSFFEIYQNEVYCLFSRKGPLRVNFSRDTTGKKEVMVIHDLQQHVVVSAASAFPLIEMGLRRRQTGETGMNSRSSRSHAIMQVTITQWHTNATTKESVELEATINLVDLAGSERQRTAKTDGKNRDEGIHINQSLSTLSRVINEISHGAKFVNYRDSLLTMVLKDNLGGNSKTFMIATITPLAFSYQETCATLQYAKDVRKIRNRPMVNKTFQTRSSILELNALLKEENERLKKHIEVLRGVDANAIAANENASDEGGDSSSSEKVPGNEQGCRAAGHDIVAEAVIAAPAVGAVPLVVTAHCMYTSVGGVGASCVVDGRIGITSLTKDVVQFRLADMLSTSWKENHSFHCQQQNEEQQKGIHHDYGVLEFERTSQHCFEQHYWVRYIPYEEGAAACQTRMNCHVNGSCLGSDDRRQLRHGDVLCIYLDDVECSMEQNVLTFHYVDIKCMSRRCSVGNINTTGDLEVSVTRPGTPTSREEEVAQLLREKTRLLEMVQSQERTIEYHRQREKEARSLLASLSNQQKRHQKSGNGGPLKRDASLSPDPEMFPASTGAHMAASALSGASTADRTIRPGSLSSSMREKQDADPQHHENYAQDKQLLYKGMMERNSTLEELSRRLAQLERSTSADGEEAGSPLLSAPISKKFHTFSRKMDEENTAAPIDDMKVGNNTKLTDIEVNGLSSISVKGAFNANTSSVQENNNAASFADTAPNADEILLKHRADRGTDNFGMMHVFLSTSEGVRERYKAANRERVLCERVWSLEEMLEDLRGELDLLESKLRIAQDANTEHVLRQAQMEDEMAEISRAFLKSTEENAGLLHDINSLENLLQRTEEALAEASTINETELDKKLRQMAERIRALRTLARMWKRRAMQRIALEFSDNNNVNKDDSGGVVSKSGQVPWDDLRVESNVTRAKQLLGECRCTSDAADAIESFEKETAAEAVIALETVLGELENENLRLISDIKMYEEQLQGYKDLVTRLRCEKEQLEKEGLSQTNVTEEETRRLRALYEKKCEELSLAERSCEAAARKLAKAVNKNTTVQKKSVKSNDLLLQEQRRTIEEHEIQQRKLVNALAEKEGELRNLLNFIQSRTNEKFDGFRDENELYDRVEELIDSAMRDCNGSGGYSAFPSDFQFSEEMVALIRICLRIMMDRLKVELYVLNRQSLHKIGLLVPAVQLRPEQQFHSYMHELRGVVSEIAGKSQRIGGKWAVQESDILSRLVDHRRRHAGNALNGLLIWYDHWDLSPKSEHVCYMELIRNRERVMQLARIVRLESLVNTNASSTLRFLVPGKNGGPDTTYITESDDKDNSVQESRRILEKLSNETQRSNLARSVVSGRPVPSLAASGFERIRSGIPISPSLQATTVSNGHIVAAIGSPTAFSRGNTIADPQQQQPTDQKFGRRATALVVPVSDNEITFAATTALVRHDSTYNYNHRMNVVNNLDKEQSPNKGGAKTSRFGRSKTDVPMSFENMIGTRNGGLDGTLVTTPPFPSPSKSSAVNSNEVGALRANGLPLGTSLVSSGDAIHPERATKFNRANTIAVPELSQSVSGRCVALGKRTNIDSQRSSPKPPQPGVTTPTSFYDPSVLKTLQQQSRREGSTTLQDSGKSIAPPLAKSKNGSQVESRGSISTGGEAFLRTSSNSSAVRPISKFFKTVSSVSRGTPRGAAEAETQPKRGHAAPKAPSSFKRSGGQSF